MAAAVGEAAAGRSLILVPWRRGDVVGPRLEAAVRDLPSLAGLWRRERGGGWRLGSRLLFASSSPWAAASAASAAAAAARSADALFLQGVRIPDRSGVAGRRRRGPGRSPASVAAHGRASPSSGLCGVESRWGRGEGRMARPRGHEGDEEEGATEVGHHVQGCWIRSTQRGDRHSDEADSVEFDALGTWGIPRWV